MSTNPDQALLYQIASIVNQNTANESALNNYINKLAAQIKVLQQQLATVQTAISQTPTPTVTAPATPTAPVSV
jgi:Spy/CpxP family protein refolding chaperone